MKAASKEPDRRNWIIRNDDDDDDVDVTEKVLMITIHMTRKMRLEIYKELKRHKNPVTKNK